VAVSIKTGRGNYWLITASPTQNDDDAIILTLVLERADGIERVAFRCRIAKDLLQDSGDTETILNRLAPWVEREFEMTRENALKAIRSERKMMEIAFNQEHRGPFG
jgi:hypothetical protein